MISPYPVCLSCRLTFFKTFLRGPFLLLALFVLLLPSAWADENGRPFVEGELRIAREMVRQLYLEHLERAPDPQGLEVHVRRLLEDEQSVSDIARALQGSPEGQLVLERRLQSQQEARAERKRTFIGAFMQNLHVLYALMFAIVLGLVISQVYKHTHRGMNFELSFMNTLVLLAPIVAMVMLFIRGDLVLSLGLIGSLSIIRFRTPIKDTRDMIFLFWTIAIGLGAGTYNWEVVFLSSLVMVPMVFLLYGFGYGRSRYADFILVCGGEGDCPADQIAREIGAKVKGAVVRSHEVSKGEWETVYELRQADDGGTLVLELIPILKGMEGIGRVSLLAPKLDLPV